jgi:NTP pyrophosphatase (non-canonical NTP hydrolase)
MNNAKEDGDDEKVLDESVYPKKDGKFTPEAMAQYLFEEKAALGHKFTKKQQKNTTPSQQGHWDRNK